MPAKTILTVLFLISLGAVVALCLRALPQRGNVDTPVKEEILIAAVTLPLGTLLRPKDVVWRSLTRAAEPGQVLRAAAAVGKVSPELDQQAPGEVYGAALRASVAAGEPIRRNALVKPSDRDFLRVVLAPRARAIAIPVATGGASTGLLNPGDRVDVILTQTFKNDPPLARRSVSETVVEGLRVLAVDAPDAKPSTAANNFGRTVTLEVTPEQAERVNVAAELGKLSLTLRSSTDTADGSAAISPMIHGGVTSVKPVWAGEVSSALGDATPSKKLVAAEQPVVEIIHGTKTVTKRQ